MDTIPKVLGTSVVPIVPPEAPFIFLFHAEFSQIFAEKFTPKDLVRITFPRGHWITDVGKNQTMLPSGKLTWQWRMNLLKMYSLLKMVIFHCYVWLPECKMYGNFEWFLLEQCEWRLGCCHSSWLSVSPESFGSPNPPGRFPNPPGRFSETLQNGAQNRTSGALWQKGSSSTPKCGDGIPVPFEPGSSSTPWSLGMGDRAQPLMTGILISWVCHKALRNWVDEFIPYYMEIWESRP